MIFVYSDRYSWIYFGMLISRKLYVWKAKHEKGKCSVSDILFQNVSLCQIKYKRRRSRRNVAVFVTHIPQRFPDPPPMSFLSIYISPEERIFQQHPFRTEFQIPVVWTPTLSAIYSWYRVTFESVTNKALHSRGFRLCQMHECIISYFL